MIPLDKDFTGFSGVSKGWAGSVTTAFRNGLSSIHTLYAYALGGSEESAQQLLGLVMSGAQVLEVFYGCRPGAVKKITVGRESFPILYTKRKRDAEKWNRMVSALPLEEGVPFKKSGVVDDLKYHGVVDCIYPTLERIRLRKKLPKGLPKIFGTLPPLTRASIPCWVEAATWYFTRESYLSSLRNPGTWLYEMANPQRVVRKRAKRAQTRWQKRYKNRDLDFIQSTRKESARKRIDKMEATDADLRWGFKEGLKAKLVRMVKV